MTLQDRTVPDVFKTQVGDERLRVDNPFRWQDVVVNDGVVEHWFEEPGANDVGSDSDPYTVTNPDVVLADLKGAKTAARV